jgi:hypothetical protein
VAVLRAEPGPGAPAASLLRDPQAPHPPAPRASDPSLKNACSAVPPAGKRDHRAQAAVLSCLFRASFLDLHWVLNGKIAPLSNNSAKVF